MMEVMDESSLEEELEEADKVGGLLLPIFLLIQEHLGQKFHLRLFQGTCVQGPLAPCGPGSWRWGRLSSCGN